MMCLSSEVAQRVAKGSPTDSLSFWMLARAMSAQGCRWNSIVAKLVYDDQSAYSIVSLFSLLTRPVRRRTPTGNETSGCNLRRTEAFLVTSTFSSGRSTQNQDLACTILNKGDIKYDRYTTTQSIKRSLFGLRGLHVEAYRGWSAHPPF